MLILTIAMCFAAMGLVALSSPRLFVRCFAGSAVHVDARNEVRAVYGGFGVVMAAALFWGQSQSSAFSEGVIACVGLALVGMALGRVVSFLLERSSWLPVLYFLIEALAGGLLLNQVFSL